MGDGLEKRDARGESRMQAYQRDEGSKLKGWGPG